MKVAFEPLSARQALGQLPELAAQESLDPPDLTRVYVPFQHSKALNLDASVVVGMRGAGKSWWTAVLASDRHREFVSEQLEGSSLARVVARVGYGLNDTDRDFPRPETLAVLLSLGLEPVEIWQAVVLKHALRIAAKKHPFAELPWREATEWLRASTGEASDLLTLCDATLTKAGRVLLVLFDAFDRLATDWQTVRRLTTGALQLGLRLRSRRSIRAKFFIRPDLEEDDEVWRFADSSKLRHAKVDLAWSSADLYSLVFMYLGNARDFGPTFRRTTSRAFAVKWSERQGVFLPPSPLCRDTDIQQAILEALADHTMGGGPKRGYTYSWVPLHLADAKGRISPRSYLLAFKKAAEDTELRRPTHERAMHYSAIQEGVVKASEVRVDEISEDYPWVRPLLEAARGATVPIGADELSSLWSPDCIKKMRQTTENKLPPRRFTSDTFRANRSEGLVDDLVELAVLYRTKDGRLNMPDIFRVGFGIRRRGGVKPPR